LSFFFFALLGFVYFFPIGAHLNRSGLSCLHSIKPARALFLCHMQDTKPRPKTMCDNLYRFLPSYGMLEDPYRHIRKDLDREDQERKERKQREREERKERKRLKCKERKARKAAEQTRFPADLSDSKEEERALKRSRVVKPPLQSGKSHR